MAVRDGGEALTPAIESVLAQSRDDFEFLIVDDGSVDETPQVVADFAARDERIAYYRIDPAGRSSALNLGCQQAQTDLIARLDADDLALPHRLECQLDFLAANPGVALVGGNALLIGPSGQTFGEEDLPSSDAQLRAALKNSCPFYHSTVVFRRSAALAVGGYRALFEPAEDYDLWLRIAEQHQIANVPLTVGSYRFSERQDSVRLAAEQALACVAAQVSARDRQAGRADAVGTAPRIDAELLEANDVSREEIATAGVGLIAWHAERLRRAGCIAAADQLWELVLSRASDPQLSPAAQERVAKRVWEKRETASGPP
jgi:glycosyl transferase family 2